MKTEKNFIAKSFFVKFFLSFKILLGIFFSIFDEPILLIQPVAHFNWARTLKFYPNNLLSLYVQAKKNFEKLTDTAWCGHKSADSYKSPTCISICKFNLTSDGIQNVIILTTSCKTFINLEKWFPMYIWKSIWEKEFCFYKLNRKFLKKIRLTRLKPK